MIKVISAEPIENHKIKVALSNGKWGVFDVSPYLDKGVFQELKDQAYFSQIKVAFGGVMWPHEQDFSPETIEMEMREEPVGKAL
jgi:hypothetical protein